MDPPVDVRGLERPSMDQPHAMATPWSAVVSRSRGPAPGMLRRLPGLAPQGLLACLDPEESVQSVVGPGLEGRRMGTQAVCGDEARAGRGGLAPGADQPGGGLPCTRLGVRPLLPPARCRPEGHPGPEGWREARGTPQRRRRRDRPVARRRGHTRGPGQGRGGTIPRPLACPSRGPSATRHRCQRRAALAWPHDPRAHGAEPCGGDRGTDGAPRRGAWNPRHAVEGGHRARGPRLVKGPERGRCAGHHGARRPQGLRSGQVDSLTARIREGGAAAADHGQERLGRERLAGLGSHHGPRIPHHEDRTSCQSGRMVASMLTQGQCL